MQIQVSDEAARWYRKELDLQPGTYVRFFPRYSSGGGLHPGFSLGISVEEPRSPGLTERSEEVTFYMEEQDLWYLKGFTLHVTYEESLDDISYIYEEEGAVN
ncbi:HesB/YadR/YfhF family protein [Paenibacillus sp. FSL R5-0810]|uniref:HesB/YadR/YfhF family protein n=1 Tax=Paenibacillus sp. FSL R5-0810 TaxID=2921659 RepID=UPI0030FC3345